MTNTNNLAEQEMENQEDLIPIDGEIEKFKEHLQSHSRTILSARFGDGKTFFLKGFAKHESIQKEYLVLHLYPVNYQVCDNKDVFELVKYDILIQLLANEIELKVDNVSDLVLLMFYLKNNGTGILENIVKSTAFVCPSVELSLLAKCLSAAKSLKGLKDKFDSFKDKNTPEGVLNSFLEKNKDSSIYECDAVTTIIKDTIENYKIEQKKKVVLVFDDMDRIDPAHLFRIVNVLSAHVDTYNQTRKGNKFGVDNIVLVLDYNNLGHIFSHFYGEKTDVSGYISKFIDKGCFRYSLLTEREKYFIELVSKKTACDKVIVKEFLTTKNINVNSNDNSKVLSIRDVKSAVEDIEAQIYDDTDYVFPANNSILKLFVVLRRLDVTDDVIKNKFDTILEKDAMALIKIIAVYVHNLMVSSCFNDFTINVSKNKAIYVRIQQDKVVTQWSTGFVGAYDETEMGKVFDYLISKISR